MVVRISVSLKEETYKKLERDRGPKCKSKYIDELISGKKHKKN